MRKVKNVETKSTLELLQEKSGNAIKLITDTIDELRQANHEIDTEHNNNDNKIAVLQATNKELDILKGSNSKIISNFEALLS